MSKIKYALGMLATGAMAGVAGHAAAATVYKYVPSQIDTDDTQPFSDSVQMGTDIYGDPLTIFTYHGDGQTNHLTSGVKYPFGFNLAQFNAQAFSTDVLPTRGETFNQTDITTWTNSPTPDPWYHVEFTVLDGGFIGPSKTYLGTIQINANGNQELDQMLYTPLTVPEPETWAMLILGLGAAGAALRARPRAVRAA